MFLPLGLYLRLRKFPIVTVLLITICSFNHFLYDNSDVESKEILEIQKEFNKKKETMRLKYLQYRGLDIEDKKVKNKKVKEEIPKIKPASGDSKISFDEIFTEIGSSTNMLTYTLEFEEIVLNGIDDDSALSHLEGFKEFKEEYNTFKSEYQKIIIKYNLLNSENITFTSVFKAMFTHGGFLHLFGNMLALLVFGIYVEARVGGLNYLLSYMTAGFVGLSFYSYFMMAPHIYLVGASANVFGILGMFYIFFKEVNMKYFIFYFAVKVVSFPIKYYFFILFILLEIINTVVGGSGIAHGAHIGGLIIGVMIAYIWNRKYNLPAGFLYQSEVQWWSEIKRIESLDERVEKAGSLLSYNPYNQSVRGLILNEVFENEGFGKYHDFVIKEVGHFLIDKYRNGEQKLVLTILSNLPLELNFLNILDKMHQKAMLDLLDTSINSKKYFLALKLLFCICEKYPNSSQRSNYLKTASSILNTQELTNTQLNHLYSNSKSKKVEELIFPFLDLT